MLRNASRTPLGRDWPHSGPNDDAEAHRGGEARGTGPTWAPDRLSVWPVEGGRYGVTRATTDRPGQRAHSAKSKGSPPLASVRVFAPTRTRQHRAARSARASERVDRA